MAERTIDLNSDLGEGFGRWKSGDDEALMKIISSANVACGYHAGDAIIMHRMVELAKENKVALGAHVGLPDLLGEVMSRVEDVRRNGRQAVPVGLHVLPDCLGVLVRIFEHVDDLVGVLARVAENLICLLLEGDLCALHGARHVFLRVLAAVGPHDSAPSSGVSTSGLVSRNSMTRWASACVRSPREV